MRKILTAVVLTMASAAILSCLIGTGFAADVPIIMLEPTSDAVLDSTLRAALNATELKRSHAGAETGVSAKSVVEAQRRRLEEMMRGMGYLDAHIDVPDYAESAIPAEIVFTPRPEALYRVGLVEVDGLGDLRQAVRDDITRQMAVAAGKPVSGEALASLEDEVLWRVRSASYPKATVTGRDLSRMPGTALAKVRVVLNPGVTANFGTVTYYGLVSLKAEDLARLQPFKQGDAYDPSALDRFRQALATHPLVRNVRVVVSDQVDGKGEVQLKAEVEEKQLGIVDTGNGYRYGLIAMLSAIAVLAIRQMSLATMPPLRSRWPWWLDAMTMVVLGTSLFFGAQRLLLLAASV